MPRRSLPCAATPPRSSYPRSRSSARATRRPRACALPSGSRAISAPRAWSSSPGSRAASTPPPIARARRGARTAGAGRRTRRRRAHAHRRPARADPGADRRSGAIIGKLARRRARCSARARTRRPARAARRRAGVAALGDRGEAPRLKMRPATHISPKGGRSSSVRTDTTLGASPIARIDATIAIYMNDPHGPAPRPNPRPVGSPPGTVRLETGGIAAWIIPRAKIVKPCFSGNARRGAGMAPPMKIL
jgi:hypothetical protein